jgi:glycerol-3-phosphate acyltransferase PlsY
MQMPILSVVISYLLGSIPFAYIVVRLRQGSDIRQIGSGNVGATNALRAVGKVWGVLTLVLDASKGFAAVMLAQMLTDNATWILICAVAAMVGHIFPIFLKFRGGKGVSTGCGVFLAIAPLVVGICAAVFVLVLVTTRYVSLGSILAAFCFPIAAHALGEGLAVTVTGGTCALLIIWKHSGNMHRILNGTERRLSF